MAKKKKDNLEMLAQALAAMELAGPPPKQQQFQTKWQTNDPTDPTDQPAVTGPDENF
jgi:hypothetical protein